MKAQTPYEGLTPDCILDAIESVGLIPTGHLTPLNSYENRVYLVGLEEQPDVVVKFYRPGRWSLEQIREELDFTLELEQDEIPVIAPLEAGGSYLNSHQSYYFSLFPKRAGHPLELDHLMQLEQTGRMLGRLHATGANRDFKFRRQLNAEQFGWQAREQVLQSDLLPEEYRHSYSSTTELLIQQVESRLQHFSVRQQRIHGDFHPGNILYRDEKPIFLDFDDCITGPAIQDIWMLLSGDQMQQQEQLSHIMKGYRMFSNFNETELNLIESYRSLRIIHYAGWLAQRWNDPAFPKAFPWFGQNRFWSDHILQLKEQLSDMQQGFNETALTIESDLGYNR